MSNQLNTPYTVTVRFEPPLATLNQHRTLPLVFQNHLLVLTGFNEVGGTVVTMFTTEKAAKAAKPGASLFSFGTAPGVTRAIITRIAAGTTLTR